MSVRAATAKPPASPSFTDLFTPKLVTVLREGYSFANLRTDAVDYH